MTTQDTLLRRIREGFRWSAYPGDHLLQGSFEGCEPYDEVVPFRGRTDWSAIEPEFLDQHYCALSFFSEAGFRFFMPAYMCADVRRELQTADPTFHLTHGFSDHSLEDRRGGLTVVHRWGKSKLINPRRYGAISTYDHARRQLSVFIREEAAAIIDYLRWRQMSAADNEDQVRTIDAALQLFWLERARSAPTAESLRQQEAEERAVYEAIRPPEPT